LSYPSHFLIKLKIRQERVRWVGGELELVPLVIGSIVALFLSWVTNYEEMIDDTIVKQVSHQDWRFLSGFRDQDQRRNQIRFGDQLDTILDKAKLAKNECLASLLRYQVSLLERGWSVSLNYVM
jgi:hypothetical protein